MARKSQEWKVIEERFARLDTENEFNFCDTSAGWTWNDNILIQDFKKIKRSALSITDQIANLKAFYSLYYGASKDTTKLADLFVNIVSSSSSFTDHDKKLVVFDSQGNIDLLPYTPSSGVLEGIQNFLGNDFAPITSSKDSKTFLKNVQFAFETLKDCEELSKDDVKIAYHSLCHTAVFLILIMLRRTIKSSQDLLLVFHKGNIHKHYRKMIKNPFGNNLPSPSERFNDSMKAELCLSNLGARLLYTIVLYIYTTADQNEAGLEAMMKVTCMTNLAGVGLPLITLFSTFKVLYNKSSDQEAFCMLAYDALLLSCWKIAKLKKTQYKIMYPEGMTNKNAKPVTTMKLFPYCRLIHKHYHMDMGHRGNEAICYIMTCLIDLKSPPLNGTGGAKVALWTKRIGEMEKQQLEGFAKALYDLTAQTEDEIVYSQENASGTRFIPPQIQTQARDEVNEESDTMPVKVTEICKPVVLGEGPHWDERQQALFYVSIHQKTIHKYVPATGEHSKTTLEGRPGFMVPVEGTSDQFVVGTELKFLVIRWDGKEGSAVSVVRDLGTVDRHVDPPNRLNDGKADPRGRLFAGTMGYEDPPGSFIEQTGALYRLDTSKGHKLERIADKVTVSNGLAWDLKEKAFYYTDSPERKIRRYDYDVETGNISNQSYCFDLAANNIEGFPDGTTIDTDGNLWVAVWSGSCVINVDPRTGKLIRKIKIPALQVTSATFGGENMDILFVTSASMNIGGEQPPPCGATFMVTGLGVKGHKNVNFKL